MLKTKPIFILLSLMLLLWILPASASESTQYLTGEVVEILSEKTRVDEAFGHEQKTIRFKVQFPSEDDKTIVIEQTYTPETAPELLPITGKKYIFYKETLLGNSESYVLIDIKRTHNIAVLTGLVLLCLILVGRWFSLQALLWLGLLFIPVLLWGFVGLSWSYQTLLSAGLASVGSGALLFGIGRSSQRNKAFFISALLGLASLFVLFWLGRLFSLGDSYSLVSKGFLLQWAPGFIFLVSQIYKSVHAFYKTHPESQHNQLLQAGLLAGRETLGTLSLLYGGLFLAPLMTQLYAQGTVPSVLQIEPALGELSHVFYLLLHLALSVYLVSFTHSKLLYRSRL